MGGRDGTPTGMSTAAAVVAVCLLTLAALSGGAAADPFVELDPDEDLEGDGNATDPYEIGNASELQAMRGNLTASYVLVSDINATGTEDWDGGAGFEPIGSGEAEEEPFEGSFDGDGHEIEGLTINRTSTEYVGLFGAANDAELGNVSIVDAEVTGDTAVGALVGSSEGGLIADATADGNVTGESSVGGLIGAAGSEVSVTGSTASGVVDGEMRVGGLIGSTESGTVELSTATAEVTGGGDVGGLVGMVANGTVNESSADGSATGESTGNGPTAIGGLVGNSTDGTTVENSDASGSVVAETTDAEAVGGLVGVLGDSESAIENSSATGTVTTDGNAAGGLVGVVVDAEVIGSNATGVVEGAERAGGLIGAIDGGSVERSTAAADVTGESEVGGLVGSVAGGNVGESYATGTVTGETTAIAGLVGNSTDGTEIEDVYASGAINVSATDADGLGGLVGVNHAGDEEAGSDPSELRESYARVQFDIADDHTGSIGGVVGDNNGTVEATYWDADVTGNVADGVGETHNVTVNTTARNSADFAGLTAMVELGELDFESTWVPGDEAPALAWDSSYGDAADAFDDLVAGDGSADDPYQIGTVYELQEIRRQPSANHTLTGDIDASATEGWEGEIARFEPIDSFQGSFNGSGYTIDGLNIGESDAEQVGLFSSVGQSGEISNLELTNVNLSGVLRVGGVIGLNEGNVSNVHVDIEVTGGDPSTEVGEGSRPILVGALIGENLGNIADASASGTINAEDGWDIGGLVGMSEGSIIDSNTSVTVTAPNGDAVGGLVGFTRGTAGEDNIANNVATGDVIAPDGENVGGLVGVGGEGVEVIDSSATAAVVGEDRVGGLVGNTQSDVFGSFATGEITGNNTIGGLVGQTSGPIGDSYAQGAVTGNETAGGLVGETTNGNISSAYATGTVADGEGNGGLAGSVGAESKITGAYWDIEASGTDVAVGDAGEREGVTGLTTDEMQGSGSLSLEFAFNPTWIASDEYPLLVREVDDYALTVDEIDLEVEETAEATVTLTLTDGSTVTATEPAEYTVDDPDLTSVDEDGVLTANEGGEVELRAAASGFEDRVTVSIAEPEDEPEESDDSGSSGSPGSSGSSDDSSGDDGSDDPPADPTENTTENETIEDPEPTPSPDLEPVPDEDDNSTDDADEIEEVSSAPATTSGRSNSIARTAAGGGAAAFGGWVAVVLFSRTELFAASAPASIASAVSAVPGAANYVLAEPEQAALIVSGVAVRIDETDTPPDADDGGTGTEDEVAGEDDDRLETAVLAGGRVVVDATIENKGDVSGAREVTLTLDDAVDMTTVDLDAHSAKVVTLAYETTVADVGKTLGLTLDCETDATDIEVAVVDGVTDGLRDEQTGDERRDESMTQDTIDGMTAGEQTANTTESNGDEEPEAELDEGTRTGPLDRVWMSKGKILAYVAGIIIIYIGVTNFADNRFAGGLGIFLGVMALPIVRAQLPTSTRVLISRYGKVLVVILAAVFSGALFDTTAVVEAVRGLLP